MYWIGYLISAAGFCDIGTPLGNSPVRVLLPNGRGQLHIECTLRIYLIKQMKKKLIKVITKYIYIK